MSLNVATGQLSTGTGAVSTTISVTSLSFDPTAAGVKSVLLLWWNGRTDTTDTVGRRTQQTGFGIAVDTTHRDYITTLAQDTPTSMVTNRMQGNAQCVGLATTADAIDGLLDFDAWLSNGFRLIVDDQFTASYTIQWTVISGTDILNATTANVNRSGTTGNQDVNVGFVPNFLLTLLNGQTAINNTVNTHSKFCIGMAKSSSQQYINGFFSKDAAANSATVSYCRKGDIMASFSSTNGAITDRATFTQFQSSPSNGFAINWAVSGGSTDPFIYLAIQFSNANMVDLGDLLTNTDTSTTITESALSVSTPKGGFVTSAARAEDASNTPTVNAFISLGAFDSTSSRLAAAMMDQDAAGTAVVGTAVEFDEVYINMPTTAATVQGLMDITGLNDSQLTFIMDDADPSQVFVWYAVFGTVNLSISCSAGTIASAGRTATVVAGAVTVAASNGIIASAGRAAIVNALTTIPITAGNLSLLGRSMTVVPGSIIVSASSGVIASAGQSATIVSVNILPILVAGLILAGHTVSVDAGSGGVTINISSGSLILSGQSASVLAGAVSIQALAGQLALAGRIASLITGGVNVGISAGQMLLSGRTGAVVPGGVTIAVSPANISLVGQTVTLDLSARINVTVGQLLLSGRSATVVPGSVAVPISSGSLNLTGRTASILSAASLSISIGSLNLTGRSASIVPGSITIVTTSGSLSINGPTSTIYNLNVINSLIGSLNLTGQTAGVVPGSVVIIGQAGQLILSGQPVTIVGGFNSGSAVICDPQEFDLFIQAQLLDAYIDDPNLFVIEKVMLELANDALTINKHTAELEIDALLAALKVECD